MDSASLISGGGAGGEVGASTPDAAGVEGSVKDVSKKLGVELLKSNIKPPVLAGGVTQSGAQGLRNTAGGHELSESLDPEYEEALAAVKQTGFAILELSEKLQQNAELRRVAETDKKFLSYLRDNLSTF